MEKLSRPIFRMTTEHMNMVVNNKYLIRRIYTRSNYETGKFHVSESVVNDEFLTKCGKWMKVDTGSGSPQRIQVLSPEVVPSLDRCRNCFPRMKWW